MFLANQDPPVLPVTPFLADGGERIDARRLEGEHIADIVVIGAGIAGCSLALHAAGSAKVAVLEAKEVGWGASGRNAGHVVPATKLEPDEILRAYGPERGSQLIAASRVGPKLVFDLAEKHGMDISLRRAGVITAAHTTSALKRLERRVSTLHRLGHRVELLDRSRTAEVIGNEPSYYLGSVLERDGGTINPLAFVRGLARAAVAQGVHLFQGTKALRLSKSAVSGAKRWRVETELGSVLAEYVVLCTNGYTDDLWPGLRQTVVPVRAYQFVTAPIESRWQATILTGGIGMTDTRRLMSGVCQRPDGRLHFSGLGPLFGAECPPDLRTSCSRIDRMFPQLNGVTIDCWWSGWMAMNWENSWKLHELAPGALAMLGCNGRGLAIATILGRDLARYIAGARAKTMMIPFSPLKAIPAYPIHRPLVRALVSYYRLRDALDDVQPSSVA